ncbi:MAG TPA: DUF2934 domain-containing protein [Verrucomicrobiae bacterium]|nr:DUF2934 domain-containing protein [Verrucomicrobiae bacterium]
MPRKTATDKPIVVSAGGAAAVPARRKPAAKRATRSLETTAVAEAIVEPSADAIAKLAYSYWEARGCQGGSPEEDWLRAEQELRATR